MTHNHIPRHKSQWWRHKRHSDPFATLRGTLGGFLGRNPDGTRLQDSGTEDSNEISTAQRQEEERLFGGSTRKDPNCVPIAIPGSKPDSLKALEFKPTNTLGSRRHQAPSRLGRPITHSRYFTRDTAEHDNDDHRRKRLRTGISTSTIGPSNEERHRTAAHKTLRSRSSSPIEIPSPPTVSHAYTESGPSRRENRWIGRLSEGFELIEGFVKGAKKARLEDKASKGASYRRKSSSSPVREVKLSAVEIPYKPEHHQDTGRQDTKGKERCDRERNESPDVLQGDKTVDDAWKTSPAKRAVSPSNIRPTVFQGSPKKQKKREKYRNRRSPQATTFPIAFVRRGKILHEEPMQLVADEKSKELVFSDSSDSRVLACSMNKIVSILFDDRNELAKVRLKLSATTDTKSNPIDIVFSEGAGALVFREFVKAQVPDIRGGNRSSLWMDNAFQKIVRSRSSDDSSSRSVKRRSPGEKSLEDTQVPNSKRLKLSDSLTAGDKPSENITSIKHRTLDTKAEEPMPRPGSPDDRSKSPQQGKRSKDKLVTPTTSTKQSTLNMYTTRSTTRNRHIDIDSDDDMPQKAFFHQVTNKKWSKPLMYPKIGRKRAEVEEHDLARLNDGEFLNDNLIEVYIRFLEHHLERQYPETFKRMYFFNSFFFATLTNTSKGKRGINYQGVEKWTRLVDILARDFVIVPINENAHWYMAIICNLPKLFTGENKDHGIADSTNPPKHKGAELSDISVSGPNQNTQNGSFIGNNLKSRLALSFGSMTLSDQAINSHKNGQLVSGEKGDWPDEEENQPSSPAGNGLVASSPLETIRTPQTASNKSKAKKKRAQTPRKYEPTQPTIIVFDSLGCARSSTIRILKEYLEEESESKRSIPISAKDIMGMNAKGIPKQSNFSDCGLYLLAYLEKFIQDPDTFVRKQLRKEMDEKEDWPKLKPGVLRKRLRCFLHKLHDQEEEENPEGPLLVDFKPLNILLEEAGPEIAKEEPSTPTATEKLPEDPALEQSNASNADDRRELRSSPKTQVCRSPDPPKRTPESGLRSSPVIVDEERPKSRDSLMQMLGEAISPTSAKDSSANDNERVQVPATPVGKKNVQQRNNPDSDERVPDSPLFTSPSRRSRRKNRRL